MYRARGLEINNNNTVCPCHETTLMYLKIPADLSSTGKSKWKKVSIDKCIASIVYALQKSDIDMRHSCCGHGKGDGDIILQDRRKLIIKDFNLYKKKKPVHEIYTLYENKNNT